MNHFMLILFESIIIGYFILTLLAGITDLTYNVKKNEPTLPYVWIVPGLLFGIFWFIHFL